MSVLSNHHAFVTGSTQGIGLEIAKALCEAGAGVVLHGRRTDGAALREARAQNWLPASVPIALGDLSEPMPQGPLGVAEEALRLNPNIDMLVCNAGTFIDQPFLDMEFGVFDRTLKLNVYSQYVLIQHFARLWVQRGIRGRILLIGSINGRLAEPTHVAYDTSKGAIDAMTRSLCVWRSLRTAFESTEWHRVLSERRSPNLLWRTLVPGSGWKCIRPTVLFRVLTPAEGPPYFF